MLQRVTSHCPSGHELRKQDGARTKTIKPADVYDINQVGWCDVCIEPFAQEEERWSCAQCSYDACWRCHEQGREVYYFSLEFTSGPFENEPIYGTIDVLKGKIDQASLAKETGDVVAERAILTFDCDLYDITFGGDPDELATIRKSSTVTFDRANGQLKGITLSYSNPDPQKDLNIYGRTINKFAVNTGYENVPDEAKQKGNWAGCSYSDPGDDAPTDTFAAMTFCRFGLIQVPGFGLPVEQEGKTLKLLREIAKDKRGIIDPMRKKTTITSRGAVSCFPMFWRASELNTPGNIALKAREEKLSTDIIDQLELNQPQVMYQVSTTSGKVNHRDLIYASRLSLLAYLIDRIPFGDFFAAERERYLLDPVFLNFLEHLDQNEGRELIRQWLGMSKQKQQRLEDHAHEAFLGKFVSTFFITDKNSKEFGMSYPLNRDDGPLHALGLEYAPLFPNNPEKLGAMQVNGTEGFIAVSQGFKEEGGDICIVFQGTNDIRDVFVSFNGVTTPFEPMVDTSNAGSLACLQGRLIPDGDASANGNKNRVHLGFYNAFLKLRGFIDKYLREAIASVPKDKNIRIVVTGHSLGGALATMCCGWLFQLFDEEYKSTSASYPVIKGEITGNDTDRLRILCVTFGSPKVGNNDFVNWLDSHKFVAAKEKGGTIRAKILRLVDVMDPIVTLPPSSGGFAYHHTARKGATVSRDGTMVFIDRTAADKYDNTTRGLGVIAAKGTAAAENHDLFLYMHKCLHFAWVFNKAGEGDDWDDNPLERAFGAPNYRYDKFTRSPDFLTKF